MKEIFSAQESSELSWERYQCKLLSVRSESDPSSVVCLLHGWDPSSMVCVAGTQLSWDSRKDSAVCFLLTFLSILQSLLKVFVSLLTLSEYPLCGRIKWNCGWEEIVCSSRYFLLLFSSSFFSCSSSSSITLLLLKCKKMHQLLENR